MKRYEIPNPFHAKINLMCRKTTPRSCDKAGELLTGKIDSEAFFTAIRRKTGRGKELSKSYEQKSALFLKKNRPPYQRTALPPQ